MLKLTFFIIFALFIVSFFLFDSDILAPPTVVALSFLLSCSCTLYNEEKWGLKFSEKTTILITTGIMAIIIGGIIGVILSNIFKTGSLNHFYSFSHKKDVPQMIYVNTIKTELIVIFQIITILMIVIHIRRVTGYSNWLAAVSRYRDANVTKDAMTDVSMGLPILTRNMAQISRMVAMVYAYVIGNNLNAGKRILSFDWLPVVLYSLTTFVQGDRSQMIRLWLTIVIITYTIHQRSLGWKKNNDTIKMVLGIAISMVIVGIVFSGVRQFVGRSSKAEPFYYLTFYAGAPIAALDQIWRFPIIRPRLWGEKTFFYVYQSLTAIFGWPGRLFYYSSFVTSPSGAHLGNANTAFKAPYVDFGFWGFVFVMVGFGMFYTFLYCKCREKRGNNQIDFRLLLYTYIAYSFFMYFYAYFSEHMSHLFIKYALELWLIRWFLVGWEFRQKMQFRFGKNECCSYFKNS